MNVYKLQSMLVKAMEENYFYLITSTKKYEIEAIVSSMSCGLIFWKLFWGKIKLRQVILDNDDNTRNIWCFVFIDTYNSSILNVLYQMFGCNDINYL